MFHYIFKIIISIHLVMIITGCTNDVDYTPPLSNTDTAITHYSFGKMVIDGKNHDADVSILSEGKVGGWSFDYNTHIIESSDFQELISDDIRILIIGIGYNSAASLSTKALEFIEQIRSKGIEVKILSTSKAVKLFNSLPKKGLLACFHLNC